MINFLRTIFTCKHNYRSEAGICTASVNNQSRCINYKQSTTRYPVCAHDHLNICLWDAVDHVCELMEGRR